MLPGHMMARNYPSGSGSRSARPAAPALPDGMDAQSLVEAATAETLHGTPDWALNMQLCDLLTHAPREIPAVIEALKKKLRSKSHGQGLLAVILLETLVKNVPASHDLIGTRDVMEATLVKSLPRSIRKPNEGMSLNSLINEPGDQKSPLAIARWEAILKAVQAWSSAFDQNTYPIFHEVHRTLQRRGVRFPPVDKEENAPVFMKPATPVRPAAASAAASSASSQLGPQPSAPQMSPGGPRGGSGAGANSDIKTSMETVGIFREMLDNSEVGYPLAEDELIQQLYTTCRSNAGILSTRLTNAANAGDTDENTMMQLISTHEAILDTLKYYEGLVSGTMRPRGSAAAAPSSSHAHARAHASPDDFEESKEAKESHHRHHPSPAAVSSGRSSAAAPMAAAAAAAPVHARRKSDLPPALAQFDMLGLSPDPVPAISQPPPQQASPPKPQQVADPFEASFPPPMNPAAVAVSTPAASPAKRSSGGALPLIAPPPTSATRHRKRGSTDMSGSPAALAAAGGVTTPSKPAAAQQSTPQAAASSTDNLLNLDFLMANDAQPLSTHRTGGADPQPIGGDLFASQAQSAFPFQAAGFAPAASQQQPQQAQQPVANIFDVLANEPAAASAPSAAAPPAPASNPFESFDADPFG